MKKLCSLLLITVLLVSGCQSVPSFSSSKEESSSLQEKIPNDSSQFSDASSIPSNSSIEHLSMEETSLQEESETAAPDSSPETSQKEDPQTSPAAFRIDVPDYETICRYVRGCEAFKDIFPVWDEQFPAVAIDGIEYPGILDTELIVDDAKMYLSA